MKSYRPEHLSRTAGLLILCLFTTFMAPAQVADQIKAALEVGDAAALVPLMDREVELIIDGNEDFYSPAKAREQLAKFFHDNGPTGFQIMHQGSSGKNASYLIGNLKAGSGSFRVYVFLSQAVTGQKIQQLKISRE